MVMTRRKDSQTLLQAENTSYNTLPNGDDGLGQQKSSTIGYYDSLRAVPWQTDNDYILTGYRRQIPSLSGCVKSAFTCMYLL